jgi:hypothetical protein
MIIMERGRFHFPPLNLASCRAEEFITPVACCKTYDFGPCRAAALELVLRNYTSALKSIQTVRSE